MSVQQGKLVADELSPEGVPVYFLRGFAIVTITNPTSAEPGIIVEAYVRGAMLTGPVK
jgi:hypothetical protein